MNRRDFHIGPGAASLLLVAVVVSMGILGMLAMMNVRSDVRLTERSEAMILAQNEAAAHAEEQYAALDDLVVSAARQKLSDDEFLSKLGEALPENMTLDGDTISWTETTEEGPVLNCEVRVRNTLGTDRIQWVSHAYESTVGMTTMDEGEF